MRRIILVAFFCGMHGLPTSPASAQALQMARTIGGQIDDLVVSEPYAYVATGRTVVTWSYADPDAPVQVAAVDKPARGRLTGLVKLGNYLYGAWQTGYSTSGVAIYSLADPAQPRLVNQVDIGSDFSHIQAIGATNGHLFLFDTETGMIVGALNNPEKPLFRRPGVGVGVLYEHAFTDGNWVHAFGKNFIGSAVLTSFDVSNPRSPLEAPSFYADGVEFFNLRYSPPLGVAFGLKLSILDLSDPNQVVLRGSVDGPIALTGIVNGEYAYGVGFDGLDVWDISDLDNPLPIAHVDMDTLATDATARISGAGLMVTRTDRFVYLDTSDPAAPKERGSALMSGSIDAYDAARVDDTVLLLQQNYGLAIADAKTLDVVGRYEFDLPPRLQARVFTDMHVDGKLAYLAAWGHGLFVADVSNPRAPVELARQEFPGAHTVTIGNNYAYLGVNTDGPGFGIVDVSDPTHPNLLLSYSLPYSPAQLEARGNYLYITGYPNGPENVGLRILDVTNPYWAREVSHYDQDCRGAFGITFEQDIPLAYVGCNNGLHILDVSNPRFPVRVGYVQTPESYDVHTNVEVRGNRAWFGSSAGVYEVDVTNAKAPRVVGFTDLAGFGPINLRAVGDDRVLALTGIAGIHVLEGRAIPLVNRKPVTGLSGQPGAQLLYSIEVPAGTRELRFQTDRGTGDITLYVKRGAPPTTTDFDARSMQPGTTEATLTIDPQPGTWYVRVVGETTFSDVALWSTYR
jgi:hypothetical protein